MNIDSVSVVSVSYNSPELIRELLSSFRQHYALPVTIVDGSDAAHFPHIQQICAQYPDVVLKHFDHNIHHGPGLAWAFQNLPADAGPVLVLDSDVMLLKAGLVERMLEALTPQMYGVGSLIRVNEGGWNVQAPDGISYMHPACMLCNPAVVRSWPMPIKHGAPMIETMLALHRAGQDALLLNLDWLGGDLFHGGQGGDGYLRHDWQGTVKRTGGYHLEEWQASLKAPKVEEAPPEDAEPDKYNMDLINLIPAGASHILEVGCNNGGLARAYKQRHPECRYTGVEVDAKNANLARRYCDEVFTQDIETVDASFFAQYAHVDTWIFGDVLEHLRDPWAVLAKIRKALPPNGCIVICLPNAQHWSVQAKLCTGAFRYEDWGLLDRTHLRFFTRVTMLEMLMGAGLQIAEGYPRIFEELNNPGVITAIKSMAIAMGADPEQALRDSLPVQYVLRVVAA